MTPIKCLACGWIGFSTEANNGEYEPPTCLYCESSSLTNITNDEYIKHLYPFGRPKPASDNNNSNMTIVK